MTDSEREPRVVHAAGLPYDVSHVGEMLRTGDPLRVHYTPEQRVKAMECDGQIVWEWLKRAVPSGTFDELRKRFREYENQTRTRGARDLSVPAVAPETAHLNDGSTVPVVDRLYRKMTGGAWAGEAKLAAIVTDTGSIIPASDVRYVD